MESPVLTRFETIASGVYLEGLAIDHQRDRIWYSDVIAGGIHGLMPDGTVRTFNPGRMWTGGVLINHDGCVLSSGAGGIMWNDPEDDAGGWLLDEIDGQPINGINEMVPDGSGGIFFGTSDIEKVALGQPPRPTALYRLTADRQVIRLAEAVGFSNGLILDEERRILYFNDTFTATGAFDVAKDLTLTNRRVILAKEDCDGMAMDADGCIWISGFRSGHFERVAPDGTRLAPVATPAAAITQLRFGGADMRDCYINTVPADGGDSLKDGITPTAANARMFRASSAIAGRPVLPTRFTLR